jgi:uncharacterized protein YuzE
MALMSTFRDYLPFLPTVQRTPGQNVWLSYDRYADTLYINFRKPTLATDSELTDDDVIVRYEDDTIIGYTVLHASKR